MKIRPTLLSGWLLICLLLAGQVSLLIHEADHARLTASGPCVICVNNSTFDGVSPAPQIAIATSYTTAPIINNNTAPLLSLYLNPGTRPRAPPRIS